MERATDVHLVAQLEDLRRGPVVFFDLVRRGSRIVPLVEALLRRPSRSISQPRRLAAEVLGAMGTREAGTALRGALEDSSQRSVSPVLRLAEDEVVDSIARQLERFPGPETDCALLGALLRHPYPACLHALGASRYAAALPRIVDCLHEDFARNAAGEALRAFGESAQPELVRAVRSGGEGHEPPSHVAGRRAAVSLLAELGGADGERSLRGALDDGQPGVRVAAALALQARGCPLPESAIQALVDSLGDRDWTVSELAAAALAVIEAPATEALERAVRDTGADGETLRRRQRALGLLLRGAPTRAALLLAPLLEEPDARVRRMAVEVACATSPVPIPLLVSCLGDVDPMVRSRADRALQGMGSEARKALQRAIRKGVRSAPHRSRIRLCWNSCVLLLRPATGPGKTGGRKDERSTS